MRQITRGEKSHSYAKIAEVLMCLKLDNGMIVCGGHAKAKYCSCGRQAPFLCDWKVRESKSGTCDAAICERHAHEVAPGKHLCPRHKLAYEVWKVKHPERMHAPQASLFTEST